MLEYLEAHESDVFNVELKERRAGDPAILISDNTKIKNTMQWQPKYDDLEVICQATLDWEKILTK